jgi:SAM-dependent methyltransferase
MSDAVGRFSGLASLYARHRPAHAEAAVSRVIEVCLAGGGLLVDVGCGTGISTRQFAARGVAVRGVEPNDEMRAEAEQAPGPYPTLLGYTKGTAEATGLPDGAAQAVLAAQAFHWFDAPKALAELHRILRPGGWAALMWYERDEADACTAAYGAVIRSAPGAEKVEGSRFRAGEVLLHSPLFVEARRETFLDGQVLHEEGLLGRAFSVSYAPREPAAAAEFARRLREAFAAHQRGGKVELRYETSLYLGRRR